MNSRSQFQRYTSFYRLVFGLLVCLITFLFGTQAYADDKAKQKRAFELYDQINSTDVILAVSEIIRS